jgi:hypothetical protein
MRYQNQHGPCTVELKTRMESMCAHSTLGSILLGDVLFNFITTENDPNTLLPITNLPQIARQATFFIFFATY